MPVLETKIPSNIPKQTEREGRVDDVTKRVESPQKKVKQVSLIHFFKK